MSHALGGLHEACFGVPDLDAAQRYWHAFGFRPIARGGLEAPDAAALYGVPSALESVRLGHLDADHGLIRLMRWTAPRGAGIGLAPLRAHGSRWVGQFVRSTQDVANHAAVARRQGAALLELPAGFIDLSSYQPQLFGGRAPVPFADRLIAVREYTLIQPLWRQALLERFHYDGGRLGRIDDDALLPASQIVNASFMVASDDPDVFAFYREVLGLVTAMRQEVPYAQATASRTVFDLRPDETHWCEIYEEPRSGAAPDARRPGRLYLFRFPTASALPDRAALSQPGQLGCTLYTWRVAELASFARAAERGGARVLGGPLPDEFGVPALTVVAPDGMTWTFQQASAAERESLAA